MPDKFREQLKFGQVAEGQIAKWLLLRGWNILPVYEVEQNTGKGPRIFRSSGNIIAPDLLALRGEDVRWIEAKRKTVFSWHRITSRWVTGIDLHHYEHYQRVARDFPWPVWLLFLHESSIPSSEDAANGCPPKCPTGLYGDTIDILARCENHRHRNHGQSGMVYWSQTSLRLLTKI